MAGKIVRIDTELDIQIRNYQKRYEEIIGKPITYTRASKRVSVLIKRHIPTPIRTGDL